MLDVECVCVCELIVRVCVCGDYVCVYVECLNVCIWLFDVCVCGVLLCVYVES